MTSNKEDRTVCLDHSGFAKEIKNLNENKVELWKAIDAINTRIDGMKNKVISERGSQIMQLLQFLMMIAVLYITIFHKR